MMKRVLIFLAIVSFSRQVEAGLKKHKEVQPSPLDLFLEQARQSPPLAVPTNGSLFSPSNPNLFLFRDVKAHTTNDIVTIQIVETASATNSANTSTKKDSGVTMSAPGLFGLEKGSSKLNFSKVLDASTGMTFGGQGSTTRSGQLQAWLSARVVEVLPNGDLVIEGTKDVTINRERQSLTIRGVVRQLDITSGNVVLSTAIAHMEVNFDGKGVVSSSNNPGFLTWLFNKLNIF